MVYEVSFAVSLFGMNTMGHLKKLGKVKWNESWFYTLFLGPQSLKFDIFFKLTL